MKTNWRPARVRFAALAVTVAVATGAWAAALAGAPRVEDVVWAYVLTAVVALFSPAAIAVQVVLGEVVMADLLLAHGTDPLLLVPVVAGIVATAELLATVARLDLPFGSTGSTGSMGSMGTAGSSGRAAPIAHAPGGIVRQVGVTVAVASVAFGAAALVIGLPGPRGLVAVVMAAAACLMLARVLV